MIDREPVLNTSSDTLPPPARDSGPYTLTVCAPGRDSWSLLIEPNARYSVGRLSGSLLTLDYPWVSERHAEVIAGEGGAPPCIVDLGSRNGTVVDDLRLEPLVPRALPSGSVVKIGRVSMLVTRTDDASSSVFRRARITAAEIAAPRRSMAPLFANVEGLIARDIRMLDVCRLVESVAKTRMSVLVTGETGVGKELIAQAIHKGSPRAARPLVALNCAAIPDSLIDGELFGYERGAFSGAVSAKPGLFEAAHGSTIFLDEVGELSLLAQSKLLRVLESGEVLRLGALRSTHVDIRVIAATNRDLSSHIASGAFRADLFYRLNGMTVHVPPLRERPNDIVALAEHFARQAGITAEPPFSAEALDALGSYSFPGNVRELKALIERAVLLANGVTIPREALLFGAATDPLSLVSRRAPAPKDPERLSRIPDELPTRDVVAELERRERRQIDLALEATGGNQKDAAKLLGISRRTLMKRLDRHGITRPRKRRNDAK